ncbi:MAG: hypothetical protein B7Y36_17370 [Novosphingobium sp. 28-62-57]|uniref:DUF1134 domain-containing protein n=1 Tax=unclassified Novosphingobium TaxID=2644732 RepID=UPI000BDDB92D|nr:MULTISPECIES: DUF1134 domain-containing protein [unclassified Novosphingobium]OYW48767.1 MAG: hypothetical protein B7Z34_12755 [Novosphingobium sp. 12-62-10]OYZ08318.1 MAG: hypothetical protein B7Y36_17370 [Novosphingobium sp. 28-62-57]OZA33231.1 MAG: hypothetical protein B7X92_11655 [Novosphingobium sp. 17-62-9]HQS71260.1 DUF1134 domain-containing protein [Novosphingobium sp.]
MVMRRLVNRVMAPALAAMLMLAGNPVAAQVESVDPNAVIDGDLIAPGSAPPAPVATPAGSEVGTLPALPADQPAPPPAGAPYVPPVNGQPADMLPTGPAPAASPSAGAASYKEDDLIGAAEGVFGKGAAGLADVIKDLLKKQGEPNAYIVGREAGGALVVGVRYGSGTLHHKVEGELPVYWTGPSIGFDAGANAASTFVLVYNLYDSNDLYTRFAAGEGQAYLIGGFHVSYMRKGDKVLIPVRSGAGLRLGVNGGYMKFSRKQNWFPF